MTGLLVDQTVDAVDAGLHKLLHDEGLRNRMGIEGRKHAGDVTWKMNAKSVLAIYRDVLDR